MRVQNLLELLENNSCTASTVYIVLCHVPPPPDQIGLSMATLPALNTPKTVLPLTRPDKSSQRSSRCTPALSIEHMSGSAHLETRWGRTRRSSASPSCCSCCSCSCFASALCPSYRSSSRLAAGPRLRLPPRRRPVDTAAVAAVAAAGFERQPRQPPSWSRRRHRTSCCCCCC